MLMPVANAMSRTHERSADRYALEMTRNAPAFVSAMKRLAAQNLAEEEPSRLVQMLFYTHPPINARIAAAHAWAARWITASARACVKRAVTAAGSARSARCSSKPGADASSRTRASFTAPA